MAPGDHVTAQTMFWNTKELVDTLLGFLDAKAIKNLALVHPLVIGLLQSDFVWAKLIKRSCPYPTVEEERNEDEDQSEAKVAGYMDQLGPMGDLINMVGGSAGQRMKIALGEIICKRFPAQEEPVNSALISYPFLRSETIQTSCMGLVLLQRTGVYKAFILEEFQVGTLNNLLLASLSSLMGWQVELVETAAFEEVVLGSEQAALDLQVILDKSSKYKNQLGLKVTVSGDIGQGGWRILMQAALRSYTREEELAVREAMVLCLICPQRLFSVASRVDVKVLWGFIGNQDSFEIQSSTGGVEFNSVHTEWEEISNILSLSPEDWERECDRRNQPAIDFEQEEGDDDEVGEMEEEEEEEGNLEQQ